MATPITHVVLTECVWNKYFSNEDKKSFILGTSFPDIRYLKIIERERTHFGNCSWNEFCELNGSFRRGMYFHSIVDKVRDSFWTKMGIYNILLDHQYTTKALKFVEDKLLYPNVKDWQSIRSYFDEVTMEELDLLPNSKGIDKWHRLLREYFSKVPEDSSLLVLTDAFGFSRDVANSMLSVSGEIEKNAKAIEMIMALYERFPQLIADFID